MENKQVRRANLLALIDALGSAEAVAAATKTDATYVRNIKNAEREMGDKLARRFERLLEKEAGWMDRPHLSGDPSAVTSWDVMLSVLQSLPEERRPAVLAAIQQSLAAPQTSKRVPTYSTLHGNKLQRHDAQQKARTKR